MFYGALMFSSALTSWMWDLLGQLTSCLTPPSPDQSFPALSGLNESRLRWIQCVNNMTKLDLLEQRPDGGHHARHRANASHPCSRWREQWGLTQGLDRSQTRGTRPLPSASPSSGPMMPWGREGNAFRERLRAERGSRRVTVGSAVDPE